MCFAFGLHCEIGFIGVYSVKRYGLGTVTCLVQSIILLFILLSLPPEGPISGHIEYFLMIIPSMPISVTLKVVPRSFAGTSARCQ